MNRTYRIAAVVIVMTFGWLSLKESGRTALATQEQGSQEKKSDGQPQMQQMGDGKLYRPLVQEGEMGPTAPEPGTLKIRPGDMIEIECAIPKDRDSHLSFRTEDEKIMKMIPAGVRQLVPLAMVAGEPKEITGMTRAVAIFQAGDVGKTMIHLNLGRKKFEYRVEVRREQEAPSSK